MDEFYLVARITSISGSEGFLNLQLITDFEEKMMSLKEVYVDFFGIKKRLAVESVKGSKKSFQIKFEKFSTPRELQVLSGREIYISGSDLAKLPDGSYFIHDLIDVEVLRNNISLGKIREVLNLPANDVFVIVDDKGSEILFPFVFEFFEKFDLKNKRLVLKPGAGEYEDDAD